MVASTPRAKFDPQTLTSTSTLPPIPSLSFLFTPILSASTSSLSLTSFFSACEQLVFHPEYQSSVILRADILVDTQDAAGISSELEGWELIRRVRRKIQPSRKNFDRAMEQECLFYRRNMKDRKGKGREVVTEDRLLEEDENEGRGGLLLLLPDMDEVEKDGLPYYHPQVSAIAFHFDPTVPAVSTSSILSNPDQKSGSLSVELVELKSSPFPVPLPENHRLFRTSLALLKQLRQLCYGMEDNYEKRVITDLLASKTEVQDLYLVLKEKYKADILPHSPRITFRWLLNEWVEVTDPTKHVFEDIAILSWLICVWSHMYKDGKPPGGFVDIGCGNGLLVYLLAQEGYEGFGFDLRARKSWSVYNPPPRLETLSLDPVIICSTWTSPFPDNSFLIGNHADELTPWLPLLAAVTPGSSFLNIPCCPHELTDRFTRISYTIPSEFLLSLPTPDSTPPLPTDHLLKLFYAPTPSLATQTGRFYFYQLYLAHLTLISGFIPEREALRIPSTKNFGFLGRKRVWEGEGLGEDERNRGEEKVRREVMVLVDKVASVWKARKPEGRAGEGH